MHPTSAGVHTEFHPRSYLFSLHINDLPDSITPTNSAFFAVDTTVYTVGSDADTIKSTLNDALSQLSYWLAQNGLNLNTIEIKVMLIRSPRKQSPPNFKILYNGQLLQQVSFFKLLRVVIPTLTIYMVKYHKILPYCAVFPGFHEINHYSPSIMLTSCPTLTTAN